MTNYKDKNECEYSNLKVFVFVFWLELFNSQFLQFIYIYQKFMMINDQGFHEMAKSFAQNLRYFRAKFFSQIFALFLRMKQNEFCEVFRYFFCAICAKPQILGKLSKIDILSLELNNGRFIPYTKKILTYECNNDYTTLNQLLPVTKSLN